MNTEIRGAVLLRALILSLPLMFVTIESRAGCDCESYEGCDDEAIGLCEAYSLTGGN